MSTRWTLMDTTTPSGKRLFQCRTCKRESATPDKQCPAGCGEQSSARSWAIDSGPEHEPRASGCKCQWEIGDSPCPVHPTCWWCGEPEGSHTSECIEAKR